jgi:hypothetical protein
LDDAPGYAYDCWLTETPEKAMKAITRHLDRSIWRDLMQNRECWR